MVLGASDSLCQIIATQLGYDLHYEEHQLIMRAVWLSFHFAVACTTCHLVVTLLSHVLKGTLRRRIAYIFFGPS